MALAVALAAAALLSACLAPTPVLKPQSRPAGLSASAAGAPAAGAESRALREHFARVQSDQLIRGLMRVDGGGPDTRFTAETLVEDFGRIAFVDEVTLGTVNANDTGYNRLRRWTRPITMSVAFGATVGAEQRRQDSADISAYAARLSRLSGLPIRPAAGRPADYHVLVMNADDRAELGEIVARLVPNASARTLALFRSPPKSVYCFVWVQPAPDNPATFNSAIILIRAEQPRLSRQACIHEEMAQSLGLIKDSPNARPSIFNDDDEFAYLTTHDEMLLKMLYDRRLQPGMSFAQARPIALRIAAELMGGQT